ncbi:hypothetical protein T484DRAFT_1929056 [Baffinella frigidus]|nr:hypothetical protein T484DRAFT_1929056 [Cryptophyta sp. CCMP2293]
MSEHPCSYSPDTPLDSGTSGSSGASVLGPYRRAYEPTGHLRDKKAPPPQDSSRALGIGLL